MSTWTGVLFMNTFINLYILTTIGQLFLVIDFTITSMFLIFKYVLVTYVVRWMALH